ncbi:MAG: DUF4342 domain-containing protein, partial [Dehalococcoidia bacterium]|nr:DUF4342 domain-containing protein [Dehalococcoidia bacterium]
ITIKQDDQVIAVFPLTVGVVGAIFAPALAAIGLLVALLTNCTIVLERAPLPAPKAEETATADQPSEFEPATPASETTPDHPATA